MKRSILLTCTGLLLAACASGSDVAEDEAASPDSAVIDLIEGGGAPRDTQPEGKRTP